MGNVDPARANSRMPHIQRSDFDSACTAGRVCKPQQQSKDGTQYQWHASGMRIQFFVGVVSLLFGMTSGVWNGLALLS
jgi:hypothetical protein